MAAGNIVKINSSTSASKVTGGDEFYIKEGSMKVGKSIDVKTKNVGNTSAQSTQFVGVGAESIEFVIEIENTGALKNAPTQRDIAAAVKKISDHCVKYEGSVHRTKYVTITYSDKDSFLGQCESMNVDYKRYDTKGKPYHAEISLKFKSVAEVGGGGGSSGNQSPDMTHGFTVREGDSLPNMCMQVYGDMKYFMAVAEHNKLTNFRELEVGSVIEFPPLDR
jgi:nucleoid-associated protein YgaU